LVTHKTGLHWNERLAGSSGYKINRITAAIGVILAFFGRKMFYFNKKSEVPPKNSKTSRGPY
jgi:hypothetical protein